MNDQLPSIDPEIRDQLGRRAAQRSPESLAADVIAALDAVSVPPVSVRRPRVTWSLPRLAGAGIGAALVVVLAAALALPAFRSGPSGPAASPAQGALTTAELATLMSSSALPANATLVAWVTIDKREDVCPMNRYPTIGVVEGMASQVCVMGANVSAYLSDPKVTGTFAFRYLAPGYLGLLGEITPASTQLAFHATDDWPLEGKTFLVDGWLGAVGWIAGCMAPLVADPLDPYGEDCPYDDWLGDGPTAPAIEADHAHDSSSPKPSYDPLSLRGNARRVEAGGMRAVDSVDPSAPVQGTFVVRSVTEACPGDPPTSSRGCPAWRVLARLPDDLSARPTSTHGPTSTPTLGAGWNPAERGLTSAELATALDSGELLKHQIVVLDAKVLPASPGACAAADTLNIFGLAIAGVVAGIDPPACVYADGSDEVPVAAGGLVLSVLGPRQFGYMASVREAPDRLAFKAAEDWPKGFVLVEGWLDFEVADCRKTGLAGFGGPDPPHPDYGFSCIAILRDSQPTNRPSPVSTDTASVAPTATYFVPADARRVNSLPSLVSPAPGLLSVPESVHGVFLVQYNPLCSLSNPTDCEQWQVIGHVDPLDLSRSQTP